MKEELEILVLLDIDGLDTTRGLMLFLGDQQKKEIEEPNHLLTSCLQNSELDKVLIESGTNSGLTNLIHNTKICECAQTHELVDQWCDRIVTVGDLSPRVCAAGALECFTCEEYMIVEVQEILALTFVLPLYQ